jgi:hypothetical protein
LDGYNKSTILNISELYVGIKEKLDGDEHNISKAKGLYSISYTEE